MKRSWSMSTTFLGCAVLLLAGLAVGCGKAADQAATTVAEKAIEASLAQDGKSVDVKIDQDGGTVTLSSDEGEMVISNDDETFSLKAAQAGGISVVSGKGAALPKDFPKDVPLPEGLKINTVQSMGENNMFTVMGNAPGSVKDVAKALRSKAAQQGWKTEQTFSQSGVMEHISCKKSGRTLNIMVMGEGGKTTVSITTGKE